MIKPENSVLIVVDIQEKLMPLQADQKNFLANLSFILNVAKLMGVHILSTEQYPQGLGQTIAPIRELLPHNPVTKTCFSSDTSIILPPIKNPTLIMCGMEAHICILQTALALHEKGHSTGVLWDATTCRNPDDKTLAMSRLTHTGVIPLSVEMLAYEWMQDCTHSKFKELNQLMKSR